MNQAMPNYVKIGRTDNLVARLQQLDNTSVPLPFECVYAVQVEDPASVERLLHQAFADHRQRSNREFFTVSPLDPAMNWMPARMATSEFRNVMPSK